MTSVNDDDKVRIAVVSLKGREDYISFLAPSLKVVAVGATLEELQLAGDALYEATVLLTLRGNSRGLEDIVPFLPNLKWIHSISAGVEKIISPDIVNRSILLTNAKGVMSSALAEYVIGSCLYFAKQFRSLIQHQNDRIWKRGFVVKELRGATMGILGYGDIGRSCAMLAKACGMKVIGLRKHCPSSSDAASDEFADSLLGSDHLMDVVQTSDYLVVALALTNETKLLLNKTHFRAAKPGQILINVSRGGVLVEDDLIEALQHGPLGGAALDVFTTEPLPLESPLWACENVLISPHNMVVDSKERIVQLFSENCERFERGEKLCNLVNVMEGY